MVDERLKNLRGTDRRNFLKWCTALGATMGLDRSGMLDAIADTAGIAMADAAVSTNGMRRFVGIVAGNGGFSWFQLLWPHLAVAKSTNPAYAFHSLGNAIKAKNTTKEFYYAPESPFQTLGPNWQMSAFMAGTNETHTSTPVSAASLASGVGMFAGIAAAQKTRLSTLIPVVAAEKMRLSYQTADDAPQVASVPNADGVVQLFSSAASQVLLAKPENARLYEATYKAFSSLASSSRCAFDPTGLKAGQVASNVLGNSFADRLTMTQADLTRYGCGPGTATGLVNFAKDLWMSLRLFTYDLSGMYLMPAFNDDPHGAFAGGDAMPQVHSATLGKIFNAFQADAASLPDPSAPGLSLADNIVFTVTGDTPKNPLVRMGWPDGTPGNSNWTYCMGNGYLPTGWFGGVNADGSVTGFDPATGADVPKQQSVVTANAAAAAVAHAVMCGNEDLIGLTRGDVTTIKGITLANPITGKR